MAQTAASSCCRIWSSWCSMPGGSSAPGFDWRSGAPATSCLHPSDLACSCLASASAESRRRRSSWSSTSRRWCTAPARWRSSSSARLASWCFLTRSSNSCCSACSACSRCWVSSRTCRSSQLSLCDSPRSRSSSAVRTWLSSKRSERRTVRASTFLLSEASELARRRSSATSRCLPASGARSCAALAGGSAAEGGWASVAAAGASARPSLQAAGWQAPTP
mmetsp:Transcript_18629/g.58472  ORF Transcript_18629/g.58472 Transcript_18629/m.58472 type:complete len:220 (+) Transcript_18629:934-1593(+)